MHILQREAVADAEVRLRDHDLGRVGLRDSLLHDLLDRRVLAGGKKSGADAGDAGNAKNDEASNFHGKQTCFYAQNRECFRRVRSREHRYAGQWANGRALLACFSHQKYRLICKGSVNPASHRIGV